MIGKTLGHYQIIEKIGEGGMGVVYKARDTHLDRFVAIKTLPAERVSDPERKRRFVQEAKAASALNHPNIVTIYDIDRAEGIDFIAMEYVSGKILDDLIPRKGMRLSLALKCAVQMSDALARAHGAGIIHRDLKPSNVMVDDHGLVKVLDFGLAKLTEAGGPEAETATERTGEGTIMGTAAYMSPEQAEGKQVDTRSDIFSFGSLLYEMLTGQRAFRGDTKASTIAAILKEEPKSISQAAEGLPREVERIVKRCLRKDPVHRFQHMEDLKVALEELKEESDSGGLGSAPSPQKKRRWAWAALAVSALVMLVVAGWYLSRPKPAILPQQAALNRLTSDSGLNGDPMLSPDGTRVVYASDRASEGNLDIWIQQTATGDRLRLTQNEADEYEPAFSPDGNRIAYRSEQDGGGIYMISALGGEPRRIAPGGRRPRFSPDGKLIAYWVGGWGAQSRIEGGVFVIPSEGGQPKQIRPDFKRAGWPEWLPDGRHILFVADTGGEAFTGDFWVTSLDDGGAPAVRMGVQDMLKKQKLTNWGWSWQWIGRGSGGDYVLISAQSGDAVNIWRVPVSARTFQVSGPAEQLTFGAATQTYVHAVSMAGGNLRMVFAGMHTNSDIWSLPLDASRAQVVGPLQRITDQESMERNPGISEDGSKLVFRSDRGGAWNVWARDLPSGKETRVNPTPGVAYFCMSRDGQRVVYTGSNAINVQAYMVTGGDPVLVCNDCTALNSLTRDGEMLIDEPPVAKSLRVVMTARREGVTILKHPKWGLGAGRLSPDERWIAFHAIPSIDARQVYIAPFRGPVLIDEKEWIPVTDGRGMERYADWSPDGNTLYFLSERDGFRCIRAQRLDPASKRPVGPALDVYHAHHTRLSLRNLTDPVAMGFHIAADKAVFAIRERTGNIWMTEIPAESR